MARAPLFFRQAVVLLGLHGILALACRAELPSLPAPPSAPANSVVLPASAAHKATGDSWLVQTRWPNTQSRHLHGAASIRFDLAALQLTPGHYRLGLIARTGTRHGEPNAQIAAYTWRALPTDSQPSTAPAPFQPLDGDGFHAVLESGEPDSWGNWYGTLQSSRLVLLRGDEHIEIFNRDNHGGVIALWIQSADGINSAEIELRVDAPLHAFTHGVRPTIHLRARLPAGLPALEAVLVIDTLDLLTDQSASSRTPLRLRPGATHTATLTPDLKPGVFRIRAQLAPTAPSTPAHENPSSAQLTVAVSPARLASDLPDDWPLGAHVSPEVPPLPGFKWYRYFAQRSGARWMSGHWAK